jgi:hypothetical protein
MRAGTFIPVRLPDNLDSDRTHNGMQFEGYLDRDLVVDGRLISRAGNRAVVTLVDVEAGRVRGSGWGGRRSMVSLTLSGVQVGGRMSPIETNVVTVSTQPNPNQRVVFRTRYDVALNDLYRGRPSRELARTDDDWRNRDRGYRDGGYRSDLRGSFHWRGRVDGSDYIELRGDRVNIRHMQARPITDATFDVRSPLPRQPVNVQLRRVQGRGRVDLVQQPSASNNYTAVVYIQDDDGGDDFYEFDLSW